MNSNIWRADLAMVYSASRKWLERGVCCLVLLVAATSCSPPQANQTVQDAIQAFNDGDVERAEEIYAAYLAEHPDSVEALRARGGMYDLLGKKDQALEDLNIALKIAPDDGVALNNRAHALGDLNRKDEAIADYEKAIVCGFDNADLRNQLAILYSTTGRKQKAVQHYGEAIRFDSSDVVFFLNRGSCLVDLGKFDQGIADFTSAMELAPEDYRAYALRYNAYVQQGDLEKAQPDGEKAHQLNPEWKMWPNPNSSAADDVQI